MRRRTLVSAIIVGLVAAASASVRASFNAVDSWYDSIFAELARPTVEAIGEDECRESVAYHFWNVTNPSEFMHGARAPRMQAVGPYVLECKTYTYKSEESVSAGIVRTYAKKYYAIDEEASCAECTADAVFHVVNTYYATLQQSLADSVFLDVTGRTAKRLLELADDSDEFTLPITQEELAGMVGASRERVNKAIASFVRLGWLEQNDRRYVITNREQLSIRSR